MVALCSNLQRLQLLGSWTVAWPQEAPQAAEAPSAAAALAPAASPSALRPLLHSLEAMSALVRICMGVMKTSQSSRPSKVVRKTWIPA